MKHIISSLLILLLISCGNAQENKEAKQLFQGIWYNADSGERSLFVKNDTIYFPDSLNVPMYFRIVDDSLELHGAGIDKYGIRHQLSHIFWFTNLNGELIKLRKYDTPTDTTIFTYKGIKPVTSDTIVQDSIVSCQGKHYHYYTFMQSTDNKVLKQTYTSEGIQVDNIYYDNKIRLVIKSDEKVIFDKDIVKKELSQKIPVSFLSQAVLTGLRFDKSCKKGLSFNATLTIPDERMSYLAEIIITPEGEYLIESDK